MSYNKFRFSPVWIVLLYIWLVISPRFASQALAADQLKKIVRTIWIFPLAVILVSLFTGLHIVLALGAPLFPLAVVIDPKSRKTQRLVGAAFLTLFAVSAPLAQRLSPHIFYEAETREMVAECKHNMNVISDLVEQQFRANPPLPNPARIGYDGDTYSVLPDGYLEDLDLSGDLRDLSDRYAVQEAAYPFSFILLPFLSSRHYYRPVDDGFAGPQYIASDSGFAFWMRGPDAVFSTGLAEDLQNAVNGEPIGLTGYAYDPTNGTFSSGDLWELRQLN